MIASMTGGIQRGRELHRLWAKAAEHAGIPGLDGAGAGRTSWSKVESFCAKELRHRKIALQFAEMRYPQGSIHLQRAFGIQKYSIDRNGGIRSGQDVAKAIGSGVYIAAMARSFLMKARRGEENLYSFIGDILMELRIVMFGMGAKFIKELQFSTSLLPKPSLKK